MYTIFTNQLQHSHLLASRTGYLIEECPSNSAEVAWTIQCKRHFYNLRSNFLARGLDATESTQRRFLRCPPNACLPQALCWILQCNSSSQHSQAPTFGNLWRSGERKWNRSPQIRKMGGLRQFDCLVSLLLPHPLGILLQNCTEDSSRHKLIDIRIFVATYTRSQ
jgi:hypothetical protein